MADKKKKTMDVRRVMGTSTPATPGALPGLGPNKDHDRMVEANRHLATAQTGSTPQTVMSGTEVEFEVGKTYEIPLTRLVASKNNARVFYAQAELMEMGQSLQDNGQDIPAVGYVRDHEVVIVDGQKRLLSAAVATLKTLKVRIEETPDSEREEYEQSDRINNNRSGHTALDNAVRWQDLLDRNVYADQAELCASKKMSPATLSKVLGLNRIPKKLMGQMANYAQTSALSIAYEISQIFAHEKFKDAAAEAETLAAEVIQEVGPNGLSREATVALIKLKLEGPKHRARPETTTFKHGAASGSLKVFASRGQLDLSFKGVEEKRMDDLKRRVEALVEEFKKDAVH
jgi:ParB family chromosome partitioning protein